jgi:hypothetical protein
MTGAGGIVEIQGTAEKTPFSQEELLSLLDLARGGYRRHDAAFMRRDECGNTNVLPTHLSANVAHR